ncbi:response regulator [Sporosarcina sp. ANT_H38]|uniref:ATP-binding protein n=1 Tax=Sporosarcina sp. ANT_H38 TaxID=2597358 RepID=UPI0011F199FE|nr:ATP-binding protein [Sporosarcina sp. ANT_H38]KAA0948558.1 response regulator [Sporosarcina sp. ANT_H38]
MKKGGIRQQYLAIALIITIILVLVTAGFYLYVKNSWNELSTEQETVFDKANSIDDLTDSINSLFFRARGYYAFQNDRELELAYKEIHRVQKIITHIRTYELSSEEQTLIDEIDAFLIDYETTSLPNAIALVEANDYEGLRKLSNDGRTDTVNQLVEYSHLYNDKMKDGLVSVFGKTTTQLNNFFLLLILLGAILLTLGAWMIQRVLSRIIRPIEQMKSAADSYQNEQQFTFRPTKRSDEIGALSDSFAKMINIIQSNEQELVSQNEELLSQQDELVDRQLKMEDALSEARYSKVRLERYNDLNHQLSFSLDKQALADNVLDYFDELYSIDVGAFWLPQNGEHSLKGFSEEMFDEFKENQLSYVHLRLQSEPYFIIKRQADYEKGISTSPTYVYDFFTAIKDSKGRFSTAISLSRIGRPFTKEDTHDIYGLIKRVSLAVDRIIQYDIINRERTLNQNILDSVNESIQFVSKAGIMEKHNRALFGLLDLPTNQSDDELSKEQWLQGFLDKTHDQGQLQVFFEASLSSQAESVSQTFYTIEGEIPKVMNVYSLPVMIEGNKAGTIFVHRDITQEHEINRMKTELVSTVSHELRTPLSSVLGFTELLLSRDMDPARQKRYLETIHKEAKRLTTLINDFLDLQRMESGKQSYNMSEINIFDIAQQTVELFPISDSHSFEIIDNTTNSPLYADGDRLVQVFTNLFSNAIKFSPEGGKITVSLVTEQDRVVVSIKDNGIGIPQNQVVHMFEKFHRFDNSYSRKIGGTGLGLSICREIIEKHEGSIWIESEENKGTNVSFSLPIKTKVTNEMLSLNAPSVVIVEDDSSIALLLAEGLIMKGFSVIHHSEVDAAFNYAKEQQPDCMVIDLMLGNNQTGWDLIRHLKEETSTQQIPIIISSALEKQEQLIEQFHVEHYMTKPYPLHKLSETVLTALHIKDGRILYPDSSRNRL